MNPELFRKLLNRLDEVGENLPPAQPNQEWLDNQSAKTNQTGLAKQELPTNPPAGQQNLPPVGAHINKNDPNANLVNFMDRAGRGDINKSEYDKLSPTQQAAALRQVNQAPQNTNAQTGDQRAAGFQKDIDSGKITRSQAANNQASGSYFKEPNKQTTPPNSVPPPPNLKTTTTQPTPQPLGSPTDTARPVNINPDSAVNLGATQSATPGQANFVAGTKLGDNTTVNARLGTDNTKQVDARYQFDPNLSATAAVNQNALGGRTASVGLDKKFDNGITVNGGLSKSTGMPGTSVGVNATIPFDTIKGWFK